MKGYLGPFAPRGRFVKEPEPPPENETITVQVPTGLDIMVYKCETEPGWISKVVLHAIDVADGKPGFFGTDWRHPEKPTREQIREQIVDMLDHEIRHQLGLEAHPETAEPT